jgi:long-chain acyl-CoA synthetase
MQPSIRHELHYGSRVVACFSERPRHVDEMFSSTAARDPSRSALVTTESRLSYAELRDIRTRVAGNLAQRGFKKGDRLALMTTNRAEFVVTMLAAARLGVIVVPMNTLQRGPETAYMLNQCEARGIVFDSQCAQEIPLADETPAVRYYFEVGGARLAQAETFNTLTADADAPPIAHVSEEDGFCILYTSGTTGRPKGALLTHLGVVHSVLHYQYGFDMPEGCVSALAVPASHVTGLVAIILTSLRVAGTVVMMRGFKARDFLQVAARERVNYTLMVPAMYNLCLLDPDLGKFDLTSWRMGGFGGAPMPQVTIQRLAQALPQLKLSNCYGATETTSPATLSPRGSAAERPETVGQTLPCAQILVCDDDGIEVEPGTPGELWIAGPMTIPGYWNDPEADRAAFAGGYWRSGDIGSIDAGGHVRIFDRRKDVINRGGYKIYCQEVEHLLAAHPLVLECAVVAKADDLLGERVHAFVVPRGAGIEPRDLSAYCARSLSEYKVPESFTVLENRLPRNANGKVLKAQLRAALAASKGRPQ